MFLLIQRGALPGELEELPASYPVDISILLDEGSVGWVKDAVHNHNLMRAAGATHPDDAKKKKPRPLPLSHVSKRVADMFDSFKKEKSKAATGKEPTEKPDPKTAHIGDRMNWIFRRRKAGEEN